MSPKTYQEILISKELWLTTYNQKSKDPQYEGTVNVKLKDFRALGEGQSTSVDFGMGF